MRLILRFLKPHWKLCVLTVFLLIVDVAGALIIPTLAAQMLREGEAGVAMQTLIYTAIAMAVAAVISGAGGILSGYTCAALVARTAFRPFATRTVYSLWKTAISTNRARTVNFWRREARMRRSTTANLPKFNKININRLIC